MRKKIECESFLEFSYVSNPTYSPDGRFVAFVVSRANLETNGYKGDVWLLDTTDRSVRQLTAMGDAKSYCWTAEGTLLFSAMRDPEARKRQEKGEELTCFYEISPSGGEAKEAFRLPLSGARIQRIDRTKYAVLASNDLARPSVEGLSDEEKGKVLSEYKDRGYEVFDELPFWFNGGGIVNKKRTALYLFDREKGSCDLLTAPLFDVEDLKVSSDRIAYSGVAFDSMKPVYPGLYHLKLSTGQTTCLIEPEKLNFGAFEFFEDGLLLAATDGAQYGTEQYFDFYKLNFAGEMNKFCSYEASIGYGSVGTDARYGGGRGAKVHDGRYYFLSTVEDSTILHSIGPDGDLRAEWDKPGSVDSFDLFGEEGIVCGFFGNSLAELYTLGGERLTHFNDAFGENYEVITPEMHRYVGTDGVEIHGWALKPAGYQAGKRYPAILHIHGGPRTVFGDVYHHEMQMWANAGYFVFYSNPRGSDGRGNEFGYISGKYGSLEYQNLMEFCDEMLQKYPDADSNRFGVTGGSYGGFMTNWIIGHTNRFKAAVSQRSISNWIFFEHTSDIGCFFTPNQMLTVTADAMQKLWDFSPLQYAGNVKTPTLFIHSDKDYRCWMGEAISMFTALKRNGVETRLCLFKDENHELSRSGKPKNRIARMREILAWMNRYLKEDEG